MKINLETIYNDNELTVYVAPNEKEAQEFIERMLMKEPMTLNEIHEVLGNLVSDDKIRKILRNLISEKKIEFDKNTKKYRWIR